MTQRSIEEGVYKIPKGCTAIVARGTILVRKIRKSGYDGTPRCKTCKHWMMGHANHGQFTTMICSKQPKIQKNSWKIGKELYYHSPGYRKACEMYEEKEED